MKRYNLKTFRERAELTQKEMADKLGIAKSTYVNIERGVTNPSFPLVEKFAEIFNCEDRALNLFKKFQ